MPKFWRNRVVLFELESQYGIDPSPTGADNAMLVRDATVEVLVDQVERELVRGSLSQIGSIQSRPRFRITGAVELAGSGAAGTAPKWGPIAKVLGLAETINAGVDVQYTPTSTNHASGTCYFYADGILHTARGCRGTGRIVIRAGEIPRLEFELIGNYFNPADAAAPAIDVSGFVVPTVPSVSVTTYTLHGVTFVSSGLEIDIANDVVSRNLIHAQDVLITGRAPRGTTQIEMKPMSVRNWFQTLTVGTTGPLSLVHGTAAGNIIEISAPAVQVTETAYEDRDSVIFLRLGLRFNASAGDDEFTLIVR